MTINSDKIQFGLADITIDEQKIGLQADKATVSIEPVFEDIVVLDAGKEAYDKRLVGYKGTVEFVIAEEDLELYQYALVAKKVTKLEKNALIDMKIGTSLRKDFGKKIVIHPRNATDKDTDITIYKAVPSGSFSREYGLEQGKLAIKFDMLAKDDADFSKEGNYFCIGDPETLTE